MAESTTSTEPGTESSGIPPVLPAPAALPKAGARVNDAQETAQPFGPTTGIAHPIPIPKKQAEWDSGYQNEHGPRPSRWESWVSAPFQEGAHATIASPWGGALLRMVQESQNQSGKLLSADDANRMYPGRPVPYTTPVDQGVALMEYNDRQKQQQMADWAAQRPQTTMGKVVSTASGFVGGLTDPVNFAVGMATGGVSELLAPEAAGLAGKVAAHYLGTLGGFASYDALQNLIEHQMGAKQKQLPEIIGESAVPAAVMTGLGLGLSALARRFLNEGGGSSEVDTAAIKRTVAELEQDRKPPQLEDLRQVQAERRAGANFPQGPAGDKITPTTLTSPLQEAKLYGAVHSDGTPLVHEHGLGQGVQLTDSAEAANNGVARSTESPGQIAETKLPEGSKLLNIDQPASSVPDIVKAIEKATGLEIDPKESLKDVITQLGDWSGAEYGKVKVPEDILAQVQQLAKSQGYGGYEFAGPNSRQVHFFDPSQLGVDKSYFANPQTAPGLPDSAGAQPQVDGSKETQTQNPALDKARDKFYSPEIEKLVHEFRKGDTFDPYSTDALADAQKDIEQYKQQLTELSKESPSAKEALDRLREQEVQDKRLADIARRIAECGDGGGL